MTSVSAKTGQTRRSDPTIVELMVCLQKFELLLWADGVKDLKMGEASPTHYMLICVAGWKLRKTRQVQRTSRCVALSWKGSCRFTRIPIDCWLFVFFVGYFGYRMQHFRFGQLDRSGCHFGRAFNCNVSSYFIHSFGGGNFCDASQEIGGAGFG